MNRILIAGMMLAATVATGTLYAQGAGSEYDTDVPGFDMKKYTAWFGALAWEYADQMTVDDERDLTRMSARVNEFEHPRKASREASFEQWCEIVLGLIEYMNKWNNVFSAEFDGNAVTDVLPPAGPVFLAESDSQPFLFDFHIKDPQKMYVLKEMTVNLLESDSIRLEFDPNYPTLFKLFLSNIKRGVNKYGLTLRTTDGKALYEGDFSLKGIEPGRIKVNIVDGDTKKPTETTIGVYPAGGRALPPDFVPYHLSRRTAPFRYGLGAKAPRDDPRCAVIKGVVDMPVLPGSCRILAVKGVEYRVIDETFDVPAGETVEKTFTLRRFVDMPSRNWYSGDDHCHIARRPEIDGEIIELLSAVDVRFTNIVQMGDQEGLYFLQKEWGEASRYKRGDYMMAAGHEDPRTTWRGHTLMYNLKGTIHDRDTYYLYEDAFEEARAQGGLTGYAHSLSRYGADVGAAISVPLDLVDFIELEGAGNYHRNGVYHLWNLGFKLSLTSGADFPYGQIPGARRFFSYIEGEPTFDKHLAAIKNGNTFTSNGGAFIEMRVNRQVPGSTISLEKDGYVDVELEASINPDFDTIDTVEIVQHGKVIETLTPEKPGDSSVTFRKRIKFDGSCWIAGRVLGKKFKDDPQKGRRYSSCAHTSPFYIEVAGQRFWERANLEKEFARANGNLDRVTKHVKRTDTPLMDKQRDRLLDYIKQARKVYSEMEREVK
ncbi:CehA/McbA family metallohydrolase [Candidatus Hydrogenedentota bacterium]